LVGVPIARLFDVHWGNARVLADVHVVTSKAFTSRDAAEAFARSSGGSITTFQHPTMGVMYEVRVAVLEQRDTSDEELHEFRLQIRRQTVATGEARLSALRKEIGSARTIEERRAHMTEIRKTQLFLRSDRNWLERLELRQRMRQAFKHIQEARNVSTDE
jgi:hypothetical protein